MMKTWATEQNRTFSIEKVQMAKKHELTISGHKGNTNQNHTKGDSKMAARGRKQKASLL
jgi:hypothetical protein